MYRVAWAGMPPNSVRVATRPAHLVVPGRAPKPWAGAPLWTEMSSIQGETVMCEHRCDRARRRARRMVCPLCSGRAVRAFRTAFIAEHRWGN